MSSVTTGDSNDSDPRHAGERAPMRRASGAGQPHTDRLLEREEAIELLRAAFDDGSGARAGPVVLTGAPGVGRTALLQSACSLAAARGFTVLEAAAGETEGEVPFGVLRQLLAAAGDLLGTGGSPALREQLPPGSPEGTARAGTVADLAGAPSGPRRRTALAVMVDDAQWCDVESAFFLLQLARRLDGFPVRLLVTTTGASTPAAEFIDRLAHEASAAMIPLAPLSAEATRRLASAVLASSAGVDLATACHELTDGRPAFLVPLLADARRLRIDPRSAAAIEALARLAPAAIVSWVRARAGSPPAEPARVLEAAAVLGPGADLATVAELAGLDRERTRAAVDRAARAGVLRAQLPLRFEAPILARAVYAGIAPGRRSHLHLLAARRLDARGDPPEAVAQQLMQGGPSGDAWAVERLRSAADLALRSGEAARGLGYLRRALIEPPPDAERAALLLDAARAESAAALPAAVADLRRARKAGATVHELMRAGLDAIGAIGASRDEQLASRVVSELYALQRDAGPAGEPAEATERIELAAAAAALAGTCKDLKDAAAQLRPIDELARLAGLAGTTLDRPTRLELAVVGLARCADPAGASAPQVATVLARALAGEPLLGAEPLRVRLWSRAIVALAACGAFEQAEHVARAARRAAGAPSRRAGADYGAALSFTLLLQGRLADAEAEAVRALAAFTSGTASEGSEGASLALACRLAALSSLGRVAEAEQLAAVTGEVAPGPVGPERRFLLEQRARLHLARGDTAAALEDLGRVSTAGCGVGHPAISEGRQLEAGALAVTGNRPEAERLATEDVSLARAFGARWAIGAALCAHARLAAAPEQLAELEEAVALLDGSGATLLLAEALVDLGAARHRAGATTAARASLRRAADLALGCGATPLVERAAAELRATGARPRRLASSGVGALTPAERRVVLLASEGCSNAEIARQLYISLKTVEGHLLRAYRKLGIRSRRQLSHLVLDGGPASPTPGS